MITLMIKCCEIITMVIFLAEPNPVQNSFPKTSTPMTVMTAFVSSKSFQINCWKTWGKTVQKWQRKSQVFIKLSLLGLEFLWTGRWWASRHWTTSSNVHFTAYCGKTNEIGNDVNATCPSSPFTVKPSGCLNLRCSAETLAMLNLCCNAETL